MHRVTFFTPMNEPMPFREGDCIPSGQRIVRFSDRVIIGGWVAWSFWVRAGVNKSTHQTVAEPLMELVA